MRAGPQHDIAPRETDQFGSPKACLDREQQQSMVAPPRPCRTIRSRQQRRHFLGIEERDRTLHIALVGHGEDTLAVQQPGRIGHRDEAEERSDGGEPGVAATSAITPRGLGVGEEVRDQIGVDVFDRQVDRRLFAASARISQQQPERIAIAGDRMSARLQLRAKPVGEEALDQRRQSDGVHCAISPPLAVARAIARSSSSGTASMYQYVAEGLL